MSETNQSQWTWRSFFVCLALSLGMFSFGYPASVIGTTFAQPAFLLYMGLVTPEGQFAADANAIIGAMSGVFQAGAFFGIVAVGIVMEKWGRRVALGFCSVLGLIGGAGVAGANGRAMFIAFRFVAGAGSYSLLALIPVYCAELSPPKLRGFFVGLTGVMIGIGNSIPAYMGLAFFHVDNPVAQWRTPLGLALIFPCLMLLIVLFVPESPRWLLFVGRREQAKEIVCSIHGGPGESGNDYAESEFYQMRKQADLDKTLDSGWLNFIRVPSYRKRAILACGYAFFGQSTGLLVLNNYGPTIYRALGYDTEMQLVYACAWITIAIPGNFIGAATMDIVGRKVLLFIGLAGCCISLIIEAAIVATYATPIPENPNTAALKMGVAALFLFVLFYSVGIDVAGIVFYSEIWPNHLRSKGITLVISTLALTSLIYLEVAPTAFATIGWKFYLVFIVLGGIGCLWVLWAIPETKGIPLEEMGALFQEEVVVYSDDIHVDSNTHQLVIQDHENRELTHVATTDYPAISQGPKREFLPDHVDVNENPKS